MRIRYACFSVFILLFAAIPAVAQSLVGSYKLLVVDNVAPDGTRVHLYGDNPQGLLTLDSDGRYSIQIYRSGRPQFAANDKSKGTPEEYKAAVQGCNTHFGRYTTDTQKHTITFNIEHASYPNWEGTTQKRSYQLEGTRLTYIVETPTSGGNAKGEVVWERMAP